MAETKTRVPVMTEMRVTVLRCACFNPELHKDRACPQGVPDPSATRIVRIAES